MLGKCLNLMWMLEKQQANFQFPLIKMNFIFLTNTWLTVCGLVSITGVFTGTSFSDGCGLDI